MQFHKFINGDQMPMLGLGTWKSNDGEAYESVREAIKIGYRHIDCAARYENELEIGQALHDAIQTGEVRRENLWLTSKLWNNAHKPEHVEPALQKTLSDLQIDFLDLYLIHWPVAFKPEVNFPDKGADLISLQSVPLLDTWQAMESCVKKGLIRHIGLSNFSIKKIQELLDHGDIRPECNQVESHPLLQQNGLFEFCSQEKIAFTAYSPLGSLDRPPRLKKDTDPNLLKHPIIEEISEEYGVSPAQILISWAINRGTATIPKSSNPTRLEENYRAADLSLAGETMDRILRLDQGFRFFDGSIWALPGSPYTVEDLWDE
jgi:alcohol dehydrogenase (NADP+)